MDSHKVFSLITVTLLIAIFALLLLQNSSTGLTGNVIKNERTDDGALQETNEEADNELTISQLIFSAKETLDKNFPETKGAFIFNEEACEFGNCSVWFYPHEGRVKGQIYAQVYDFTSREAPSISVVSEMNQPSSLRSLSSGPILVKEFEEEYGVFSSYYFEVNFPCSENYWIKIGINRVGSKILEKGAILEAADDISRFCAKS